MINHIVPKIKKIELIKFEWDCTYIKLTLNIKNKYPVKLTIKDLELNLVNSSKEKFAYIICDDFAVKSMKSDDIILYITIYNKEISQFIHNFINLKESVFKIHIISGKLYLFSIIPINLSNKEHDIDTLDIIKHLYNS